MAAALIPLGTGCRRSEEREVALARIDDARHRLAALAPLVDEGLARQSVTLAREALLDAERAIRREGVWEALASSEPVWKPGLERALASTEAARFVVERERAAERDEARQWLDAAAEALRRTRRSRLARVSYQVETQLRGAERAAAEAERLFRQESFSLATDKAQEAVGLAGELPPEAKALLRRLSDPANRRRWSAWVHDAIEATRRGAMPALVVDKHAQLGVLFAKGRPTRWLDVDLGYNGLDRKLRAGDGATPEGRYHVVRRKGPGETSFYKALLLDYPNGEDRERFRRAKAAGELGGHTEIGGLIEIHGEGGRGANWTDGCIAVSNDDMDDLFELLKLGSTVVIVGSYDGIQVDRGGQ